MKSPSEQEGKTFWFPIAIWHILDGVKADYIPLCCPSQTLLHWQIFFPAGLALDGPLDKGTGNKYGPMGSACYAKEHVHIDAFGILSPIDPPSALHIYTF